MPPEKTNPVALDSERLAAFLEGRLSPADAAAVQKEIASLSEADLAALADVAALLDEEEEEDSSIVAIPLRKAPSATRWVWTGLAAAAVVAAVYLGATRRPPTATSDMVALAPEVPAAVTLGDSPPWSVVRGGPSTSHGAAAVRLGITGFDLAVARQRGDSSVTAMVSARFTNELLAVEGAAPMVQAFQAARDGAAVDSAVRKTREFIGASRFDAGMCLEALRLGAEARSAALVGDAGKCAALAELSKDATVPDAARKAVGDAIAEAGKPAVQYDSLTAAVQQAIRELAR